MNDKVNNHDDIETTASDSPSKSSNGNKKKNIPLELTAYGTTPSGKPRLFVCQVCTRAFARLEHLRRHERSHTKEKPFSCGVCQRKFSRRDLLLRHAQKLHAGCSDAITRLRRKSIKKQGGEEDDDSNDLNSNTGDESLSINDMTQYSGQNVNSQNVEFNLDLFSKNANNKISKPKKPSSTSMQMSSSSNSNSNSSQISRKNSILQRQVFQKNKFNQNFPVTPAKKRRGTSFSAQSGANYAMVPDMNDIYPNPDNVEFSTPQLIPTSMSDEINWLNNLSTIPGMLSDKPQGDNKNKFTSGVSAKELRENSISGYTDMSMSRKPSMINDISNHGSFSLGSNPDNSLNTPLSNPAYMMPTATITDQEFQNGMRDNKKDKLNYGYSFYDIPETMLTGKALDSITKEMDHNMDHHTYKALTPIKQESEDERLRTDQSQSSRQHSQSQNFDLNFLNDIDELTHEFDVNSKFMPNGYSFYGDNPSVSSSGIEVNSPHILSPQLHMNGSNNQHQDQMMLDMNIDQNQLLHIENTINNPNIGFQNMPGSNFNNGNHNGMNDNGLFKNLNVNNNNYFKNKLFTNNMRHMINKSLNKYPISGIMTPSIPSNEKLEYYLTTFVQVFLSHFPFIHLSKLNEYDVMNMTSNEDPSNESARVCFPLLIATMGALLANNKNDSEHLYEASRRTIHIYLESRKNSMNNDDKKEKSTVNPLWLIQSLTLSVIYGLFSDNENNVYIVIRQLNALNSLVKTSIKSNRAVLFSINGEDEEIFNKLNSTGVAGNSNPLGDSLFSNTFNDELKFKNNINTQSQTRIVLMIYRLTNFLLMMYNVPLTLSINDLQNITLPSQNDELLWSFKNYADFQEYCQVSNNNHNQPRISLDDKLQHGQRLVYKDILMKLSRLNEISNPQHPDHSFLKGNLSKVSKFGFICILHGIYEVQQYDGMESFDTLTILEFVARFIPSNSVAHETQRHYHQHGQHSHHRSEPLQDSEKLDYAMLSNFITISSIVNFKLVKEQSWLRNFDELTKNFDIFLTEHDPNNVNNKVNDQQYLKIVDCCIMIIKLVLFKSEDILDSPSSNTPSHSLLTDYRFLNSSLDATELETEENTLANFEKQMNIRIYDEFDSSSNSIQSQMLFHVFTVLTVFSIYVMKKNNSGNNYNRMIRSTTASPDALFEINHRFSLVLKLLDKIENSLKLKFQINGSMNNGMANKLEHDFTNLYLFNSSEENGSENFNQNRQRDNSMNYNLEKSLYILKVGEIVLNYLYDDNIKVSIFKKLSGSLLQLRKFLIDNETRILA